MFQAITEFLPISSTAHLILAPWIFGWDDPGLAFDVVLHLGTLSGIIAFFRKDFYSILQGMISGMMERKTHTGREGMVGWYIIIGTIPAGLAGLFLKDQIETVLRDPRIIALALILFGLILLWAEAVGRKKRRMDHLNIIDAIVIGCAQALALIPGVSRSGITITAGLFRNLERATAARLAFLLSTPVIMAGGLLSALDVYKEGLPQDMLWPYVGGFAASAVSGVIAIKYLLLFFCKREGDGFFFYRVVGGGFVF